MRNRSLLIFAAVAALLLVAAIAAVQQRAPQTVREKELLLPELKGRINDAAELEISGQGRSLHLVRSDSDWLIRDADDYPADFDRIRRTLVGMTELRLLAPKTRNPDLHHRLGVEAPDRRGANSILLVLRDGSGAQLASLVVGRNRRSSSPLASPGLYVRLPDSPQALLVEGRLEVSTQISDWFDRDLFDVADARIRSIVIEHGDGTRLHLERAAQHQDLAVVDLPDGKEIRSAVMVSRMGTILESLFADNVRSAERVAFPEDTSTAVVTTFDGLVVSVKSARIDEQPMAAFEFRFDPSLAITPSGEAADGGAGATSSEAEARELAARTGGWIFQVPAFKHELFNRRLDDMIRDAGAAAAGD
jgi:hypothetical protein